MPGGATRSMLIATPAVKEVAGFPYPTIVDKIAERRFSSSLRKVWYCLIQACVARRRIIRSGAMPRMARLAGSGITPSSVMTTLSK